MLNEAGMAINRVLLLMNTKLYECNRYMAARITTVASTGLLRLADAVLQGV